MTIIESDVDAWYDFQNSDADSSTNSRDVVSKSANITYTTSNALLGTHCADFTGGSSTDKMTLPSWARPTTNGQSLSLWLRSDSTSLAWVASQAKQGATGYNWQTFIGDVYDQGAFGDDAGYRYASATTLSTGVWYHLVVTADASAAAFTALKIYVDGSEVGTYSSAGTFNGVNGSSQTNYLGNNYNDNYPYNGKIQQAIFFNRVLTSTEVSDLYNGGSGALYADFFSDGTNTQINIGDAWKSIDAMKINIGDVWKDVAGAQINIGDVWKSVF